MADEAYRYDLAGRLQVVPILETLTWHKGDLYKPHRVQHDWGVRYALPKKLKRLRAVGGTPRENVDALLAHIRQRYLH